MSTTEGQVLYCCVGFQILRSEIALGVVLSALEVPNSIAVFSQIRLFVAIWKAILLSDDMSIAILT